MPRDHYYVYIMTNTSRTLYTGVTNNLVRRVYEHKNKLLPGFTADYNITELVYGLLTLPSPPRRGRGLR